MIAATTGLLLDPLAEDSVELPAGLESRKPTSAKHSETIAPELEGLQAGAAVSTVRTLGLIAAIESLHTSDPEQHGLVVEQDPPPGTRLTREGIVILRVGQPAEEPPADKDPAGEQAPAGERDDRVEDDTRAWFATLVQPPKGPPPCREKPDREETGRREPDIADTQPLLLPTALVDSPASAAATRRRRAGLLGAGVVAGAATVGALAIHAQGRPSASEAPRPRPHVAAPPAPINGAAPSSHRRSVVRPRARDAPRRHVRPTAEFRPSPVARSAPSLRAAEPAPETNAIQRGAAAPPRISRAPRTGRSAGQFSYLGQ